MLTLTLFSTGVTLVYDDISHHRLVFLLGDPNHHPSSGPGPQFALDVDLSRATRSVTVGRSAAFKHRHQNVFQRSSSGIEISSRQLCRAVAQSTQLSSRTDNRSALALHLPLPATQGPDGRLGL